MRLTVHREDPVAGGPPREETFEVPDEEGMTVLDALMWVRRNVDPSVTMRYACRSANACKECVAVVNGTKTYMCTTLVEEEVRVGPLPGKPLLRDLAVEL